MELEISSSADKLTFNRPASREASEDSYKPETPPRSSPTERYALNGPQVEYQAAYWLHVPKLKVPELTDVIAKIGNLDLYRFPVQNLDQGIVQLKQLTVPARRNDTLPDTYLSHFINLQKLPFGAIFNAADSREQYRVENVNEQRDRLFRSRYRTGVRTGRELARMFEIETPGLLHRQALNWLLYNRPDVSPPRHSRIWLALELAIYSSLSTAWHFKWAYDDEKPDSERRYSFRLRPDEYDPSLYVTFDYLNAENGSRDLGRRRNGLDMPGTPRHPAYPSGHSTYSAAASRILQYFFAKTVFDETPPAREINENEDENWPRLINPDEPRPDPAPRPDPRQPEIISEEYIKIQLERLADNIGWARLWGGVHWGSDHVFGQRVGEAVADCIIDQLESDCVPVFTNPPLMQPPTPAEIDASRAAREATDCPDNQDHVPPLDPDPETLTVF